MTAAVNYMHVDVCGGAGCAGGGMLNHRYVTSEHL